MMLLLPFASATVSRRGKLDVDGQMGGNWLPQF